MPRQGAGGAEGAEAGLLGGVVWSGCQRGCIQLDTDGSRRGVAWRGVLWQASLDAWCGRALTIPASFFARSLLYVLAGRRHALCHATWRVGVGAALCYRCGRSGHKLRDCPLSMSQANAGGKASAVCLRCGRADCPCAGKGDYFRCGVCGTAHVLTQAGLARAGQRACCDTGA